MAGGKKFTVTKCCNLNVLPGVMLKAGLPD